MATITLTPTRPRVLGEPSELPADVRQRRATTPVALVSMPFAWLDTPSIQLGSLGPIARSHGFPTETFPLFLDFANIVGADVYGECATMPWPLGDWIFAAEAFPEPGRSPRADEQFVAEYASDLRRVDEAGNVLLDAAQLLRLRREIAPAYLDHVMGAVDWDRFAVVGFSATFQQNVASFALARRLRVRRPDVTIVFGGSNFDGDMGLEWVRTMTDLDYAVIGEGDVAFPSLLAALADGADPIGERHIPGVYARRGCEVVGTEPAPPFEQMDELPVPDYSEYFERLERLGLLGFDSSTAGRRRQVLLPFESARGCWWGAKRHCTFCGLNGQTMSFRAKSPDRVVAELGELARRHHSFDMLSVDSILAPEFIDDVFGRLAEEGATYRLFYEVKADLSREQLRRLRLGGVRQVQPGIESLSSHVLALMRKGTRASTNVNLLRWCRYYGIEVSWNLLWGFPRERVEDYEVQNELIPFLTHLQPARKETRIVIERFSPLFNDRDAFPVSHLEPTAALHDVYPATVDLDRAAYDFDVVLDDTLPDGAYVETSALMDAWRAAWRSDQSLPTLAWWSSPGLLQIEDRRDPADVGTHTFEDPLASIYLACGEGPVKAGWVRDRLELPYPVEEVSGALDEFCARGLMMRDGNLFLALAVPATGGIDYDPGVLP